MNTKCTFFIVLSLIVSLFFFSCGYIGIQNNEKHTDTNSKNCNADLSCLLPGPINVNYTIKYYDIVNDKMKEYSDTAYFEECVPPQFFLDKLSELMQMRIGINSVCVRNDAMIIDFSSMSAPLNGTGSYEESCILESISEIMFSVYDSINYIYYTNDGKDYESGHVSLSKEVPYAQRQS